MHPPAKPALSIPEQDNAPDAAGLEPSLPHEGGLPSRKRKSWVEGPARVSTIMALALPTLVEQVLALIIGFTDTVVAGHTGGTESERASAAAAVGSMMYFQWFSGLMTSALGVGATAIVARSIGANKPRLANRVAGTACTTAFLVGIGVALLYFLGAWPMVYMFGLRDRSGELGVQYLHIMCWTLCFQTAAQIGMACLRGAGDTVRPMMVTAAITVINGIASPALTFGWFGLPTWGVRGNATGTLLAFLVAGAVTFSFLLYGKAGLRIRGRHLRVVPHLLDRILKIGFWSFLEGLMLFVGQSTVVMLVMKQVDRALESTSGVTVAAHMATLRIESAAFLPGFGFGIACSALVGQYLGANKPLEAERATVLCNRLALLTMTLTAIPMVVPASARWLLGMLVDSQAVVNVGYIPLMIAGLAQPGFAISIIKSSALKGAGDTKSPMYTTMTGMGARVVVVIGMMLIFSYTGHEKWGLILVWAAIFLDLAYRAVVMHIVFARGKWKLKKV